MDSFRCVDLMIMRFAFIPMKVWESFRGIRRFVPRLCNYFLIWRFRQEGFVIRWWLMFVPISFTGFVLRWTGWRSMSMVLNRDDGTRWFIILIGLLGFWVHLGLLLLNQIVPRSRSRLAQICSRPDSVQISHSEPVFRSDSAFRSQIKIFNCSAPDSDLFLMNSMLFYWFLASHGINSSQARSPRPI